MSIKILPIGDSLTLGFTEIIGAAPGGYRTSLISSLAQIASRIQRTIQLVGPTNVNASPLLLPSAPYINLDQTHHSGYSGFRIDQLATMFNFGCGTFDTILPNGYFQLGCPNARSQINYVLIMLGTNDILQGATAELAAYKLRVFIDSLYILMPKAIFLVAKIPPLLGLFALKGEIVSTYNGYIDLAFAGGKIPRIYVVDNYTAFTTPNGKNLMKIDGIHPDNAIGYDVMGANWFAVLAPLLLAQTHRSLIGHISDSEQPVTKMPTGSSIIIKKFV